MDERGKMHRSERNSEDIRQKKAITNEKWSRRSD